jgi:23S rRNA-/tRNA-specific pseudouridylate synthase
LPCPIQQSRQNERIISIDSSTPEAEKRLRELLLERKIIKQYLTIVRGSPTPEEGHYSFADHCSINSVRADFLGVINIPIVERDICGIHKMMLSPDYNDLTKLVMPKGKRDHIENSSAITKYRVIDANYGVSLVECQPVTGRQTLSLK